MSAIQFMKSFEETQNIMESIADRTAKEQKTMLESAIGEEDYTDDEGVFNMGNMLDVKISDGEDMQPKYYNTPVEELTDGDKNLIVNEFTKMLMELPEEVIDFSDIGPVATVIQNRFGFKQDVEGFLRDTITKASDWQQSQVMSHGNDVAGEEIVDQQSAPVDETGGPTDIAPTKVSPTESAPTLPAETTAPVPPVEIIEEPDVVEPVAETPVDLGAEVPAIGEEVADVGAELGEDVSDVGAELGEEVADVGAELGEEGAELGEEGTELGEEGTELGEEGAELGEEGADVGAEEVADEGKEEEEEEGEESEEDKEDEPKLDAKLESIRIDYQLESIRNEFLNSKKVSSLVEDATHSLNKEKEVDAQLEAIKNNLLEDGTACDTDTEEVGDEDEVEVQPEVMAQLESISNAYHAKENAKIAVVEHDKKVTAQLEAISANYHNAIKAEADAKAKEEALDAKLNGLVESFQNSKKANLKSRQEIKAKIEQMNG